MLPDGSPPSGYAPGVTLNPDLVPAPAFSLAETLEPHEGPWHQHARHQLLYASAGTMRLEVAGAAWLLPPQRAAWIGGGVAHRVSLGRPVALRTVWISPSLAPWATPECRVFAVDALAREMILHSARFDAAHDPADPLARAWFTALAGLAEEWAKRELPLVLPVARSEGLARAMAWTRARLAEQPAVGEAARAAGMSPRTLARRFREETGGTWAGYLRAARMMRAAELLSAGELSVTEVAFAVGYQSLGSFSRTFTELCGLRPSELGP